MTYSKRLPIGIAKDEQSLLAELARHGSFCMHLYTHQIGQVFSALSVVEDTIINALWMCDDIEVDGRKRVFADVKEFQRRKSILQGKTFGNLIRVLTLNGVSEQGLLYFQFLKAKRDKFIHRFFEDHAFPGDLRESDFIFHIRDLRYFELIFARAPCRIWKIIGSEKYHHVVDLGPNGLLIMNDLSELNEEDN